MLTSPPPATDPRASRAVPPAVPPTAPPAAATATTTTDADGAAMRRILIERAEHRVSSMLPGATVMDGLDAEDARFLDRALVELEAVDPHLCRLAELRLLCNLTNDQAATILGMDPQATKRCWDLALDVVTGSLRDQHAAQAD